MSRPLDTKLESNRLNEVINIGQTKIAYEVSNSIHPASASFSRSHLMNLRWRERVGYSAFVLSLPINNEIACRINKVKYFVKAEDESLAVGGVYEIYKDGLLIPFQKFQCYIFKSVSQIKEALALTYNAVNK